MTRRKLKPSGLEWLGDVPEHWEVLPVRYVARLESGHTPSRSRPDWWENCTVPWFGLADVWQVREAGRSVITETAEMVSELGLANSSARVLPKGTVMLSRTASVGFAAIMGVDMATTQDFANWVCGPRLNNEFLLWTFRAMRAEFSRLMMGSTHNTIYMPDIASFRFALPPLPEQTAIAAFLDRETGKIDALVEEQRRLIELLKEKRQAIISHAVTKGLDPNVKMKPSGVEWLGDVPEHWEVTQLKRQIEVLSGFAFPSDSFTKDEADTRLLRGVNVSVGRTRWEDVAYWRRTPGDDLDGFVLQEGDVVLGMDRPWIEEGLRVARLRDEDIPALLLQRVAAVRPKSDLLPEYLLRLLQGDAFFHHCFPEMTGVSVPHISATQVGTFVVAIPPVGEQQIIGAYLIAEEEKIDALVREALTAVGLLQERRAALVSAAVTGKIDVRESAKEAGEIAA